MITISLRATIIIIVAVVAVTVLLVVLLPMQSASRAAVQDTTSFLRLEIRERLAAEVKTFFDIPMSHVSNLLTLVKVGQFDRTNPYKQAPFLAAITAKLGQGALSAMEADGMSVFSYIGGEFDPTPGQDMFWISWANGTVRTYLRNDTDLSPTNMTWNGTTTYDPRTRGWYETLKQRQGWSGVFVLWEGDATALLCGGPMIDPHTGEFFGVFSVDVRTKDALAFLLEVRVAKTGRVLLLERSSEAVLGGNWNESTIVWVNRSTHESRMALLDDFEDPLLRRTVAAIGHEAIFNSSTPHATTFDSGLDRVLVDIVSIQDEFGLDLRLMIMIQESDFLEDIHNQINLTIIISVAVSVVSAALAAALSFYLLTPLKQLHLRMEAAADLKDNKEADPFSLFTEIRELQSGYMALKTKLNQLRAFVPAPLFRGSEPLASSSSNTETDFITFVDPTENPLASSSEVPWGSTTSAQTCAGVSTSSIVVDGGLNLRQLTAERNVVSHKQASVLSLHFIIPALDDFPMLKPILDSVLAVFVKQTTHYGGVIDQLFFPTCRATFNAHMPCYQHQRKATAAALAIEHRLLQIAGAHAATASKLGFSIVVDTAQLGVGVVGTDQFSASVVIGSNIEATASLHDLVERLVGGDTRVMITERTRTSLGNDRIQVVPIDVTEGVATTTLFSVIPRGDDLDSEAVTVLRDAVTRAQTDLASAKNLLESYAGDTTSRFIHPHWTRLLDNFRYAAEHNMGSYSRIPIGWWLPMGNTPHSLQSQLITETPEREGNVYEIQPEVSESSENVRVLVDAEIAKKQEQVFEQDTGLFSVFMSKDENSTLGGGGASMHDTPTRITDVSGATWLREADILGTGSFGKVYRGWSENGAPCALKVMPLSTLSSTDGLLAELEAASKLRHVNIVCYYSTAVLSHHFIMVMEYVPGGTLQHLINCFGALPPTMAQTYLRDILQGLTYLHATGYTHADLKPENVLVSHDGMCKLTDFGCALNTSHVSDSYEDLRGTPRFMAPEVASGQPPTAASDIFAVGLIAAMLWGQEPWGAELPNTCGERAAAQFIRRLATETTLAPKLNPAGLSDAAIELFQCCTARAPGERKSAMELLRLRYFQN